MDLYNKLKADKSITEDDFVELIQQLFEYTDDDGNNDDSSTYNIAANIIRETDYDKVLKLASSYPVIFKTFLLQPEQYAEFLLCFSCFSCFSCVFTLQATIFWC